MKEKVPVHPLVKVLAVFFSLLVVIILILSAGFWINSYQQKQEKKEIVSRTRDYLLLTYKKEDITSVTSVSTPGGKFSEGPPYFADVIFQDEPKRTYRYRMVNGFINQVNLKQYFEGDIQPYKHLEFNGSDLQYIIKQLEMKTREHLMKKYKDNEIISLQVPLEKGNSGYAYKCAVIFADEPHITYNYIYLDGEILQVSTTPKVIEQKSLKHIE
ncbi:DUF3139 domain-containing protein [Bacillus massiliigorillae]|uniref:DUF3139 domain-containing protein n=1 Tax=Bacillus massiliigorillae TaxID=1243664 RepID=UPI0003A32811|nr:DUF3139 domain-containing protein [Bacillus massiliigorillae]